MKIRITGLPSKKKAPSLYGFGGNLGTNGADFTDGLTYFNVPTRHETNPNGGIPLGIAPDGQPNLVEGKEENKKGNGGEIKWNSLDYIFSDRLTPSEDLIAKWRLAKSFLKYTYADVVRKSPVVKEAEQRPNDPKSLDTLDKFLADVAEDQELTKKLKEAALMLEQLSQMSDDELMALGAQMSQLEEAQRQQEMELLTLQPDDYDNLAQDASLENIQSAALMNQMAQQLGMVQPLMMGAEGGRLFAYGGEQPEVMEQMPLDIPQEQQPMSMEPQQLMMPQLPMLEPIPQEVQLTPLEELTERKPAEEMSTRELNEALDEIIEYAKETKDRQLLREAKKVKRSGTREEKEAFVDDTFEEIEMAEQEAAEQEQLAQQELAAPQEIPLEVPQEQPVMMAEGGEMPTEEQQANINAEQPLQSLDGERLIQQLLQIGDQLGYGKDSEYTPLEVEDLLTKASLSGIDVSSLQSQSSELLAEMLTLLLKQVNNQLEVVQPKAPEAPLENLFDDGGGLKDGKTFNLPSNVNDTVPYTINTVLLEDSKKNTASYDGISKLRYKLNEGTAEHVVTVNEGDTRELQQLQMLERDSDGIHIPETIVIGHRPRVLLSPLLFMALFPTDDEDIFANTRALIESTGKKPSEITSQELAQKAIALEENKRAERKKYYLQQLLGYDYPLHSYMADGGPIFAQGGSMSLNNDEGNHVFAGESILPDISWNDLHPLLKEILERYGLNSDSTNEQIINTLRDNPLIREELAGIEGNLIFVDNKSAIDRFIKDAGQEPIYYNNGKRVYNADAGNNQSSWSKKHSNASADIEDTEEGDEEEYDDGPKYVEEKATPKMRRWAKRNGVNYDSDDDLITRWNEHQSAIQRWGKTYENLNKEDLEIARRYINTDVKALDLKTSISRNKTETFLDNNAPGWSEAKDLTKVPEDLFEIGVMPSNWNYATNGQYEEGKWDFSKLLGNNGESIMESTSDMPATVNSNNDKTIGVIYNGYTDYAKEHNGKYQYDGREVDIDELRNATRESKEAFVEAIRDELAKGNFGVALNMLFRMGAGANKGAENLYYEVDEEGKPTKIKDGWDETYIYQANNGPAALNHGYFKKGPGRNVVYRIKGNDGLWLEVFGKDPTLYKNYYEVNKDEKDSNNKTIYYNLSPINTNRNLVTIDGVTYKLPDNPDSKIFAKNDRVDVTPIGPGGATNTDLYYDVILKPATGTDETGNIKSPYPYTNLLKFLPFFNFPYLEGYSSYNEMANAANGLKYIGAPDHREYLKYTPSDLLYRVNQALMAGTAANRGIAGLSNRNQGTLLANLALLNAKNRELLGEIGLKSEEENWNRQKDVVAQHNQVDSAYDLLALEADKANLNNNPLLVDARQKAATLKYAIEKGNNDSKAAWQADMLGLANSLAKNEEQWYWYDRFLNSGVNEVGADIFGRGSKRGVATPPYRSAAKGGCLTIRRKRRNRLS